MALMSSPSSSISVCLWQVEGSSEELHSNLQQNNEAIDEATLAASRTPNVSNERREQMERAFETKAYWSTKEATYYDSVSHFAASSSGVSIV